MRTSGPITAFGAITVPAPISARGPMTAPGSIVTPGFEPRRRMHQRARRHAARLEQRGRPQRAGIQLLRDRDEGAVGRGRDQHRDVRAARWRRTSRW